MIYAPSEDSDQPEHPPSLIRSIRCPHDLRTLATHCTAKTLIRLGGCPGWSESSRIAQMILLVLSCGGSYDNSSEDRRNKWKDVQGVSQSKIAAAPPLALRGRVVKSQNMDTQADVRHSDQPPPTPPSEVIKMLDRTTLTRKHSYAALWLNQ